jgi:Cu/Ag efflux pump CusA
MEKKHFIGKLHCFTGRRVDVTRLGSEFMPPREGSILSMPVTLPDVSNSEVKRILQVQDKIIKSIPEVTHVLGKAGRANTATDNSPISMIENNHFANPITNGEPEPKVIS